MNLSHIQISMVEGVSSTITRPVGAVAILQAIKEGRWREQVARIRHLYAAELKRTGSHKKAKKAVEHLKKNLPGVMWSGTFRNRQKPVKDKLITHSGLLCADIDVDALDGKDPKEVRAKLQTSPYVFAVFRSPTDGLKPVVRVPADASQHDASYRAVEQHILDLTGVRIDEACTDSGRICFVSDDPNAYLNLNAREIEPLPCPEKPVRGESNAAVNLNERQRIAVELLGAIRWDSETHGFLTCPGKHLHTTDDAERDCEIHLDGAPTLHCFHNHCTGIRAGVNHELQSRIGMAERAAEVDLAAGINKNQESHDELTSLTSLGAADYPAPLDEAAFHGLAGEIVRRIEPHTEADPAALLFQFLVGFGNLIGHDHYIVADGTRHSLNVYGILVGQSSKGRKGTSWNHTANVLERVDSEWREDRITFGLSSGEGLIWAVRDPIEETKPIRNKGRFTGEYETYLANHGEDDKRLLVIEAEFANVLKVMTREGNTLSPVIRCAWDSGDLKTMVKNSPAKATKAHISIVGHITRDELRRLLTQTESANGFANRFCWLAVKRSKCLPDGGAIHTVNFEDVVAELQSAANFAKDFVEIARDPEARKLWHEVYPSLSEAQPGMSGAVIGRAEAQVMRLSAIYALLDKSARIRPEHHHAAMALWRYCEQSARWVFGTSTGDRNADKIIAALKVAGEKGLTKWQITTDVFNRHATKFEIDEALRTLHALRLAYRTEEKTGGRPSERWFYGATPREESEENFTEQSNVRLSSHTSHPPPVKNTSSTTPDAEPVLDLGTVGPEVAASGSSLPLMITKEMEAQLKQRGFTQTDIDKLTPQQAHEILDNAPAAPVAGSDQEIANDIVIGEDPEGETIL